MLRLALLVCVSTLAVACSPAAPPNPIVRENGEPGSPPEEWDIPNTDDPGIEGFATQMSVLPGETVRFKIRTNAPDYRVDLYRMGWYGGAGARRVATLSEVMIGSQPVCEFDLERRALSCANWFESAAWDVPREAASGIYFAKLTRSDTGGANHVFFVVREAKPRSALVFQTSDTTWQAYNRWEDVPGRGYSFYRAPGNARPAVAVSYDRPFAIGAEVVGERHHFRDGWHGIFAAEYPMVRFLERNGYDVSYVSGADTDRHGDEIREHAVFLSVGHDEYWSGDQRRNVELARAAGVHLAFFSGGELLWKTRWEDDHRTLVCYKEPKAGSVDPSEHWTGQWNDVRGSDAGRPGNALSGTAGWFLGNAALEVPARLGRLRFWRNTEFARLARGSTGRSIEDVVGYEWDEDRFNPWRPHGLMRLSFTPLRRAAHSATLYRFAESGALVFGAGTIQWSWGLDGPDPSRRYVPGGRAESGPDRSLQQATVNLFAEMGVQPGSLEDGLVPATASADRTPPVVSMVQPRGPLTRGKRVVLRGTAKDEEGAVAAVQVAIAGAWRLAAGGERWETSWVPRSSGPVAVSVRAVDDSGNVADSPVTTLLVD